jgi:hypothetical protein
MTEKRKIIISALFLILFLSFALAGTVKGQDTGINPLSYDTFGELLDRIFEVIFYIALILAPVGIVIGAFVILSAGATPSNIALGKKIILYSAVILGIMLILKGTISYFKEDITLQY